MLPPAPATRRALSRRGLLAAVSATVIAVPALSGCFASSAPSDGAGEGGKRLRVAMMQPPRSGLSPLSDDAFKLSRWSTAETLVRLDAEGDAQPMLATKWRQDGRTWTFELREGVTFHDGTKLTATDVVRSLQRAVRASPKPRILDGVDLDVAADGARGVRITTADVDPLVPQRLSSPQLSILAAKAYGKKAVNPVGAGTGPFELTRSGGTSYATLDRYDDYWGGAAKAAGIDVKYIPDGTARAAALRSGEADIVEAIPVAQASLLEENQITEVPMPRTNTLYLNTESGPFRAAGVRAAAREAIDARSLVKGVYEGRADVADGLLGPALPWAGKLRSQTTGRAKATDPDGAEITIGTFTDRAELPEVAAVLQQPLRKAGFKVKLEIREYANIEADALDGEFDAFILSRATILDSGDPAAYLYSDFASDGSFNIPQLADAGVDTALDTAGETPSGDKRRHRIMDAEAAVLKTDAAIPMLHERVIQGDATNVVGSIKDPRERELVGVDTYVK
ncbi:ABC transporter substrate-binding protein [Streptomyces sp. NPDC059897]|uniref:ABC transporter substrate-binding protein n=1 Tax=Streptomyces sp. NPDC059897 TaxID=3346994 RepID=UPI00364CA30C